MVTYVQKFPGEWKRIYTDLTPLHCIVQPLLSPSRVLARKASLQQHALGVFDESPTPLPTSWSEKISLVYTGFSTSKIDSMYLALVQIIASEIRLK